MGTGGHGGDWRSAYSRLRVGYRCHLNVALSVWYRRRCLDRYLRKGKGKGMGGDVSSTSWKRISPSCASGLKQTFVCQDAAKVVLFSRWHPAMRIYGSKNQHVDYTGFGVSRKSEVVPSQCVWGQVEPARPSSVNSQWQRERERSRGSKERERGPTTGHMV